MTLAPLAPIALFTYNRPDHTRDTLAALAANRLASKSDLFIYSDGAKSIAQVDAVDAVRVVLQSVSGFRSVTVIVRDSNWGLAENVIDGVTSLCDRYGRVIVLEDDLLTAPQFLEFMNTALNHYADNERVMQISGHSFLKSEDSSVCTVLPMTTSWGWGTWKRSWKHFDPKASGYGTLKQDHSLRSKFDIGGAYPYFNMLEQQIRGRINSWAILWYLSVFMRQGVVIYPPSTLIKNKGFDGSGTHCGDVMGTERDVIFNTFEISDFPDAVISSKGLMAFVGAMEKNRGAIRKGGSIKLVKSTLKRVLSKMNLSGRR